MKKVDFIKILTEEISNFDFLGNDESLKEQEVTDLLQNEELQKQFICDSLLDVNNKVKIVKVVDSQISGNWDENNLDDANKLMLDYSVNIDYMYDATKEPLNFDLIFNGDNIGISVDGWEDSGDGHTTPPEGESWYNYFNWDSIDVGMYTIDGDQIDFLALKKAPPRIQILFIRNYVENFIETNSLDIRTPEMNDKIQNIPFC